ncbi:competence type IV pilus minor pilin ComGF [Calidifontibacillus oryziterrae]|uniref:competence type IV pilus minor pilin ComGF n=1 Tax=Calidifontibacillus oryziterrae TaxID=1191699 RepID=UPI000360EA18|nr:ComGF family competence protein [Calidifontibacillus oryziterrae]
MKMGKYVILLKNNELRNKGFTMLDFLFSFSIFLIIASFFPMLIKLFATNSVTISYDVDLLFAHMEIEIVEACYISVSGSTLLLTMGDGRIVSFEKYHDDIRRRVNGAGNEIIIQDIEDISYELVERGVIVTVQQNGKWIKKRLSLAPIVVKNV